MKQSSPSPPRWDQSGQMCVCISLRYQSRPSLVGQGNNGIHGTISIGFLSHMFCERDNHLAWIIRTFNSLPMWPSLWGPYCSTYYCTRSCNTKQYNHSWHEKSWYTYSPPINLSPRALQHSSLAVWLAYCKWWMFSQPITPPVCIMGTNTLGASPSNSVMRSENPVAMTMIDSGPCNAIIYATRRHPICTTHLWVVQLPESPVRSLELCY